MSLNRLSNKAIREHLPSELIRWETYYSPVVESTQKTAAKLFRENPQGGVFAAANFQTGGRGRQNNSWISPKGKSLLFSFVLLPGHAPSHLHLLTIASALSVCDAVRKIDHLKPHVKWPNDVLLNGKKICGILTEMISSDGEKGVVAGIGLNVNQRPADFPSELREHAASLRMETGRDIPRLPLLRDIMKAFENHYFMFQKGEYSRIINQWKRSSAMLGRSVSLQSGKRKVHGVVIDLEDNGAIVLRLDNGRTKAFLGSDCRLT